MTDPGRTRQEGLGAGMFAVASALTTYLTRDPAETLGAHIYVGLVSNLGIIYWSVAAAVALFSAWPLSTAFPSLPASFGFG